MSIMTSPIKSKSSGIYYFRQAVPKPLIPMIGKREFKVSLKTTNLREAKRLILPLMASANEQISIAQRKLNGDQEECFDADSMQTLTSRDCCIIADRWYEQAKAEIEKTGRFEEFLEYSDRGDGEVHSFGLSDTLSYSGAETKRATRGEWKTLAEELSVHIDFQLSREGLSVTKYSDEYIELAKLFYDRVLYLESICLSRYKRDWSFEPFTRLIASESLSVESHHKQAITGKHKSYTSINDIYV